jgi:uncharacterized protein (UPF0335 family)
MIRDGIALESAAAEVGMSIGEARLTVQDDLRNPPGSECYEIFPHRASPAPEAQPKETIMTGTNDRLRLLIERIERLEEEKKGIADDIKDVYAEAKAVGFDTKILRKVVAIRKMDSHHRNETAALLETYLAELGIEVQGMLL